MKRISTEFKIGVIVTFGIAVLITGVNYLKGFKVFEKEYEYVALYDNIQGLAESNPVTLNGYKIGQIQRIDLAGDGSGKIKVIMIIQEKELKIPKDSRAEIYSSDLLGSKAIRLKLGKSSSFVESKDTLLGSTETTLKESVNRQVLPVKNKAEKLIGSIDSLVGIVQAIFSEEARSNISSSFQSIDKTLAGLDRTAQSLDAMVKEEKQKISDLTEGLNSFVGTLNGKRENLSRAIDNLEALSDSLSEAEIPSAVRQAKSSLEDLSTIIERVESGEGSLGKLTKSDTLHNNLVRASEDLDALLKDMRYHPDRYVHFSLFGKKEKGARLSKEQLEALERLLEEEKKPEQGEAEE